jgi:integrase
MYDLAQFPGISEHGNQFRYDVQIKGVRHRDAFDTPHQALAALLKLRGNDKQQRFGPNNIKIKAMAESWLERSSNAESTKDNHRKNLNNYIYPFFGATKVRDITVVEIGNFSHHLKNLGLAELTRRNILLGTLKQLLNRAVADLVFGVDGVNPVNQLYADDRPSTKRLKQIRLLTQQEEDRLFEAAGLINLKWKAALALALYAGLRQGEILDLVWSRVDWKQRKIQVTGMVKTEASDSWVPMIDELHAVLRALWEETEWRFGSDYVIPSEARTRYDRGNLDRQVRKCIKAAGIEVADDERLSLHPLRHNLATSLIESGVKDNDLKLAMRHSSTQVSRTTYEHIRRKLEARDDSVADAVALAFRRR